MLRAKHILRANKLSALRKSKCHFSNAESAEKSYWKRFDEMRKTPTPSYKSYYAGPVIIANPQKDEFQEFLSQFTDEYWEDLRMNDKRDKSDILSKYLISQPLSIEKQLLNQMNQDLKKEYKTSTISVKEFDDEMFIDDIREISHEIQNAIQLCKLAPNQELGWFNLVVEPNRIKRLNDIQINEALIGSLIDRRIMSPLEELLEKVYGNHFSSGLQNSISIKNKYQKKFLRPDSTIVTNKTFKIPVEHKLRLPDANKINENNLLEIDGITQCVEYMLNYQSPIGIVTNMKCTIVIGFMPKRSRIYYKAIGNDAEQITLIGVLLTVLARTFKGQNKYGKFSVGKLTNHQAGILTQILEEHKAKVSQKFAETVKEFKEKINGQSVSFDLKDTQEFDDTFKCTEIISFEESFQLLYLTKKDFNKYFVSSEQTQNEDDDASIEINVFNLATFDRFTLKDVELFEDKENEFFEEYNAILQYEKVKDLNQGVQEIVQPTKVGHGYLEIKIGNEFVISGPFIAHLRKLSPDSNYKRFKDDLEKQMRILHKNGLSIKNRASFNRTSIPTNLNSNDVTTNVEGKWCFKFPSGVCFTPERDIKELKDL